ncbi:50S ribosomal protein L25 [Paenibacillus yanchengensis]|uniref:Large ribosomal subunit protein bL25 n=1 Tax=Paenibacillus yanchengensis TaxID=2035833 RepID=A0ABW4YLQ2_9BACL
MSISIHAEQRQHLTRSGLKQLRSKGRVPGIIFGSGVDNAMIHISRKEFHQWAKNSGSGIVNLQLGEKDKIAVLLEDIQQDPVSGEYLHMDFLRVRQDEVVRTRIPVQLSGTPKGTKVGGIIQTDNTSIEVEALPGNLPSSLEYDISEMEIGDNLQASDIVLPANVALISSPDEFLMSIVAPKLAEEEATEEAATEEA